MLRPCPTPSSRCLNNNVVMPVLLWTIVRPSRARSEISCSKYTSSYLALASPSSLFPWWYVQSENPGLHILFEWETPTQKEVKPTPSGREFSGPSSNLREDNVNLKPVLLKQKAECKIEKRNISLNQNQTKPLNHKTFYVKYSILSLKQESSSQAKLQSF